MCFVNLTKACDSINLALWKILGHCGVEPIMHSIIHQFHNSMQAHVRTRNDKISEWFDVEQGFRLGCVIAPLLFDNFCTAMLHVALAKFRNGGDVL